MEMLLRLWEVLTGALDACANARNMTVSTPHSKTSASPKAGMSAATIRAMVNRSSTIGSYCKRRSIAGSPLFLGGLVGRAHAWPPNA